MCLCGVEKDLSVNCHVDSFLLDKANLNVNFLKIT